MPTNLRQLYLPNGRERRRQHLTQPKIATETRKTEVHVGKDTICQRTYASWL